MPNSPQNVNFAPGFQDTPKTFTQHKNNKDNNKNLKDIMTKRLMAMLTMLVCVVGFTWADNTVATTPSTTLKTGYYVIKTFSDKTGSDGAYTYGDTSNKEVRSTNKTSDFTLEGGSVSDEKYVWGVTVNADGSIVIKNKSCDYYFGAFAQGGWPNYNIKDGFDVNTSANLNVISSGTKDNWYVLRSVNKENVDIKGSWGSHTTEQHYLFVCANTNSKLSYWYYDTQDAAEGASNTSKFQFYEVTYDAPVEVSVTYDYYLNGESKKQVTVKAMTKSAFPAPTGLPAFVSASAPRGEVSTSDNGKTYGVICTSTLPFQTSTAEAPIYYYMENMANASTRLYANGSNMSYRESAQASALNDVRGDLWYVTGNPFDGLEFHNVGANRVAQSSLIPSDVCELAFSSTAGESVWYPIKVDDNTFGLYRYSNWVIGSGNIAWTYVGNKVKFEKIDLNASLTDATYHFQMTPATISLPLNYSAADDARFATTCLPYAVEVADEASSVKAYAGQLINNNTELDMAEVNAVPANQGVIIKGNASDENVVLRVIGSAADITNDLKGTTSELTDLTGVLSFGRANGNGKVGFFRSTNATLKANRAYVKLDGENQASLAMRFDGTATSIDQINGAETIDNDAPIYDLTGRQVSHLVKGSLYIQGGRKFIAQ